MKKQVVCENSLGENIFENVCVKFYVCFLFENNVFKLEFIIGYKKIKIGFFQECIEGIQIYIQKLFFQLFRKYYFDLFYLNFDFLILN